MRNALIFFLVLLIAAVGYAYYKNATGLAKLLTDARAVPSTGFDPLRRDLGPVFTSLVPYSHPPAPDVPIATLIDGHLVSADGSPFSFPADWPASKMQYFAIYYSASWCAPCQAFTPVLADWYRKFKPGHPNFELIFVSHDHDKQSMLADMKNLAMPWPAFSFDAMPPEGTGIDKYANVGLPDLVLVDAGGKVLSDSFSPVGSYLGPQSVLDDIKKMLGPGTPAPSAPPHASLATASAPTPAPAKRWSPPDVMPAQPNWTWTTLDGTTYNNVVVTMITPDSVSFTHSMGVAHDVPIANLPPDIQKKLNYDPVAASAARQEAKREEEHPYYKFADRADAENVARQMHWPVAWMDTDLAALSVVNPAPDSEEDMAQRAVNHLKSRAIIIVADGNNDLGGLPPIVLAQFFVLDDGPMPGGHHFYGPKIVFSDPDVTRTFGRISHTQIKTNGDVAFDEGLAAIPSDWTSSPSPSLPPATPAVLTVSTPPTPPTVTPSTAPVSATSPQPAVNAPQPWAPPDPIPAQPNWTWTTMDGTTYQNVVITKIEPDTVSITHSLGVAHIAINLLPRDLQKQLNYTRR